MKKIIICSVCSVLAIVLVLGYNIEYDAKMTDKEMIEYFNEKDDYNDDLIVDLLSNSKINNIYCKKSNKQSLPPYSFVNKWIIAELDTDCFNGSAGFDKVNLKDESLKEMKTDLTNVIDKKGLTWCKPVLDDNIEWFKTTSYFDDLHVKLSTYVYFGVDNETGKIYLVSYQH